MNCFLIGLSNITPPRADIHLPLATNLRHICFRFSEISDGLRQGDCGIVAIITFSLRQLPGWELVERIWPKSAGSVMVRGCAL